MDRKKLIPLVLAGALTLVVAVGLVTYNAVYAQTETPPSEEPSENTRQPRRALRGECIGGIVNEDLAAALGIDVETLEAAQETAAQQALEQAVSEGLITQEQADRFAERGLRGFHFFGRALDGATIDYDALLADALGVSVEELEEAYATAFNAMLDRAVEEGVITEEQAELARARQALNNDEGFHANLQLAFEEVIQQAVKDGVITQEQADLILENMGDTGFGFGRGRGGWHHRFGERGFGRGMGPRHFFFGEGLPDDVEDFFPALPLPGDDI